MTKSKDRAFFFNSNPNAQVRLCSRRLKCACTRSIRFYRDTGMEGWTGGADGTKVMVFEVDMPHCGTEGFSDCEWNRPAVWALNSKVSHLALFTGFAGGSWGQVLKSGTAVPLQNRIDFVLSVSAIACGRYVPCTQTITITNDCCNKGLLCCAITGRAHGTVRMQLPRRRRQRRLRRVRHRGSRYVQQANQP